jgi:thymidylate synthase (FAD)
MRLIKPSTSILSVMCGNISAALQLIETAGRTCYKSEEKQTDNTTRTFIAMLLNRNHESVLEHSAMTIKFICDRGVSHELVRHRLASFSQESTRYCNYSGGVTFVIPPWIELKECEILTTVDSCIAGTEEWVSSMLAAEETYIHLINKKGWTPQQARSVLPNALKTELVVTANFREWRHIFKLRTAQAAHPQMRELMVPLLARCKEQIPVIFDDIN